MTAQTDHRVLDLEATVGVEHLHRYARDAADRIADGYATHPLPRDVRAVTFYVESMTDEDVAATASAWDDPSAPGVAVLAVAACAELTRRARSRVVHRYGGSLRHAAVDALAGIALTD